MGDLSNAITLTALVAKFAEVGIDVSERSLRQFARKIGACRIVGKTMFFLPEDIEALLEASKPKPHIEKPSAPSPSESLAAAWQIVDRLKHTTSAKTVAPTEVVPAARKVRQKSIGPKVENPLARTKRSKPNSSP